MSLDGVRLEYIDTFDKAMEFKRWLGERHGGAGDVLGVDTETTGLHMFTPESNVRLIQFGDGMTGWAMAWEFWKGLALEVLTKWEGDYVGHNFASFDVKFIEAHSTFKFPRHRLHDTMIQAHIVDPLGPGSLKPLANRFIDSRSGKGQRALDDAMSKNGWGWDTVPVDFPPYHMYGALDPVLSVRLHEKFMKKLGPGKEWAEVYDLELAVRHVVTRMEQRGMRLDVDYSLKKSDELLAYANRTRTWGQEYYGINLGSGPQLKKIFQGMSAKFDVFSEKTGEPSADKQQLHIFSDDPNPEIAKLAKTVLNLRKAEKLGKDYLLKCANLAIPEADGDIVHASMRTLAARTSRMSISDPPLQQLSKQDATVRNAFIAREGNAIVTTDFSQIELRLLAHFSKDDRLVEAFRDADATGGDFFVNVAREVYQDSGFQKSDKRRGLVKSMIYGLNYGAGVPKMAETAGVAQPVMRDVVQRLEKAYPGIRGFMKQVEHVGMQREKTTGQGYIITPYGRRLPCDEGKVYTLVNYCLAPDTPILMSDLSYAPAMKIAVGDRLVGFDEHPTANPQLRPDGRAHTVRRFRTAIVEAVSTVRKPTSRITLSDGRVLESSNDHLWLVQHHTKTQPRTRWARTDSLFIGTTLHSIGPAWNVDTSREAGWLAGLYDGEGCLTTGISGGRACILNFSQLPGAVMDKFRIEMDVRMLPYSYQTNPSTNTGPTHACNTTGVANIMRILGTLRPTRFESKYEAVYDGVALTGGVTEYVTVVDIQDVGETELTSIQTSTRTLVADGVLSHNCLQGHAAEYFKRAIVNLDAAGWGDVMLVPVHDEIVMDLPKELAEQALKDVPRIMQNLTDYAVPLLAESDGPYQSWGEKYR